MKNHSSDRKEVEFRILARAKAEELTAEEVAQISGGGSGTLNCGFGNGTGDHVRTDTDGA